MMPVEQASAGLRHQGSGGMSEAKLPLEAHPLAAIFPMMPDEELAELAEDIKVNGLIHPIVLDAEGLVVDGRNRLRACEIAEVEPRFERLNGHDVIAFIVSANLARRNLSKSQKAMALAMIYPASTSKGGRGKKDAAENIRESRGFSRDLLEQARFIYNHNADLAQDVLHARKHFDVALKEAREAETRQQSHDARMAELRVKAPDVAALIDDERLTIEAGLAELSQRQQAVRRTIDAARAAAAELALIPSHVTVLKGFARLTDADLALIGADRDDVDPLIELTTKQRAASAAAAAELRHMKRSGRR
jgi:hypothetical protein